MMLSIYLLQEEALVQPLQKLIEGMYMYVPCGVVLLSNVKVDKAEHTR